MPVGAGDQTGLNPMKSGCLPSCLQHPVHHIRQRVSLNSAKGDGREPEFQINDIVRRGVLDCLPGDTLNYLWRAEEVPQDTKF